MNSFNMEMQSTLRPDLFLIEFSQTNGVLRVDTVHSAADQ